MHLQIQTLGLSVIKQMEISDPNNIRLCRLNILAPLDFKFTKQASNIHVPLVEQLYSCLLKAWIFQEIK